MQLIRCDICKAEKSNQSMYGSLPWRNFEYIKFNTEYTNTWHSQQKDLCPKCFEKVMTPAIEEYNKLEENHTMSKDIFGMTQGDRKEVLDYALKLSKDFLEDNIDDNFKEKLDNVDKSISAISTPEFDKVTDKEIIREGPRTSVRNKR